MQTLLFESGAPSIGSDSKEESWDLPDYFDILGLPRGRYSPAVIRRAFFAARTNVLARLGAGESYSDLCARLDALHLADAVLGDPEQQGRYLASLEGDDGALVRFRQRIAASLEDGLLRCSRRDALLAEGRSLGLSDFQTHLLIAHVQFGDDTSPLPFAPRGRSATERTSRLSARFAAVGVLAFALFLGMVRWLGA